ncbi:(1-_4)-alpha-D-glucan 1-alpha-D-glucosylmutase [Kineosphaera limosa]|uniref:Maltooligosyltrehalose synthase n=1 Tax=Kineosphaera limosa NBRC 100340 TaxID=1184609 RepID=K6XAN7_9MICO|nr:malto-oligosyltrehalose synthase [Kineosphaera limosa]NYD99763.1 (1->4)-alpha-D-glucan 1-alpha-D-glucosylmutase [Kineosphaera limosa]GAB95864.1 maltooligosyltrehalose synthase [Kineosphaera limosa NBRC 100340]
MPVTSTYRLQMHGGFGFADAERIVPYLARLGVSHLYLSPILLAVAGSMHGYDVVDHTRINPRLGGRVGFEHLARTAGEHGMGIVVDVVPNHMAFVAPESANLPLWYVLRDGRDAKTASWFDIDWKAGGGRLGLPVLGDDLSTVLENGELVIDQIPDPPAVHDGLEAAPALVVRYHEHVYPIALGTEGEAQPGDKDEPTVRAVLDRQHYRLTNWRDKDDSLNYRRFFEVDGLIAVRVELPEVFEATHELLLELNHAGLIDGFRIDHPDGLADPTGYLDQLRQASRPGTLVWVEKILEGSEELPQDWHCAGTTGYDAMRVVQAALVDTMAEPVLTATWRAAGGDADIEEAVAAAKRQVVAQSLVPEVERLTRRAREVNPSLDPERLRAAIVELLVAGEVYRAYVRPDEAVSPEALGRLDDAFARARAERPDLRTEVEALRPLTHPGDDDPAALDFAVRLQQTWGPVMAKGIEDTTFYRWHRLIALNEVGGDPLDLDRPEEGPRSGRDLLNAWSARQVAHWPDGMTTLSTHDTKRSEDVRARLLAVAGDPQAWQRCSAAALEWAQRESVDGPTAHFLWQTILGVGAISSDRLDEYLVKALREAKQHTAWVDGDPDYEQRVLAFAHEVRDDGPVHDAVAAALAQNSEAVRATVLGQKALALTMPGVPDTYQGCELVDLSLVDPDNRRPVDYDLRLRLLERLDAADGTAGLERATEELPVSYLDAEKLWLTASVLRLRRDLPEVFAGGFTPLDTDEHVFGYVRGSAAVAGAPGADAAVVTLVVNAPARLRAAGGWADRSVSLPPGAWLDVLTQRRYEGEVDCAQVFAQHPVAVLRSL